MDVSKHGGSSLFTAASFLKNIDMPVEKVTATEATLTLIAQLAAKNGPLMFHQSGGCCDGSQPMCFVAGEFKIGSSDLLLGHIGGYPFYISADQYEYWKHTQIIVDVTRGRGSSFSLEIPLGLRFFVLSRTHTIW